jgi:lactate 2-monooxygenase
MSETSTAPFAGLSPEIYLGGMGGARPDLPIDLDTLAAHAQEVMTPEAWGYVAGGAGSESTMRANRDAFDRWRIVPRMLRDVSVRDLSTDVLGTAMPAPILTAPLGVQSIIHPDAELATTRAVAGLGLTSVLSTASSYTLEEVAAAAPDAPRWFQLYWPRDPEVARSLLSRAEAAAYRTVVVTLDTTILGWRPRDLAAAYLPFLQSIGIANYLSDPAFRAGLAKSPEDDPTAAVGHFVGMFGDPSKTWDDLAELRSLTSLPLVLKGVLDPDDARRAVDAGVDGVIVSNHGGRQVDGAIGSLAALPRVVDAVQGQLSVLFDSGVRTGGDVMKALCLGAAAVLVGRPFAYGLALGGETGVRHVLRCLLADFDLTMALSGRASLAELGREVLVPG